MILILIHHIHLLMYVPTIAVIVVLRYYLVQGLTAAKCRSSELPRSRPSAFCFSPRNSMGSMAVPQDEFVHYLQGRMADPSRTNLLSFSLYLVPAAFAGNPRYLGSACLPIFWACRCSRC